MNQNRTHQTPINRNSLSQAIQAAIAYEERMAFVDSICASLNESRFGSGSVSWSVVKLSTRPELEPAVFFYLCDDEPVPDYALSPMGRGWYQGIGGEYRKVKQMGLLAARPNGSNSAAFLASNLGRGSPLRKQISVANGDKH